MKQAFNITAIIKEFSKPLISAVLLLTIFFQGQLYAQTDTAKKVETEVEKESTMISPSVEFIGIQKSDNSIDLKAKLKAKIKGVFIKLPLLKVRFLLVTDTIEKEIGFVITDHSGIALFIAKANSLTPDKEGKLHIKAVFAGNKSMEPADAEITMKRARLEITPVKADSLLTVKIKLIDVGVGKEIAVDKAVVGIYVHRLFYPLKLGEGTTDENGEATVEIPNNLPGDAKGNIVLMAKLDENEVYGNLEASMSTQWGVPVSDKMQELPRALWSGHAPVWMLVTFIILMLTVWGHYIVIVYELLRLRKEEPHQTPNTVNL